MNPEKNTTRSAELEEKLAHLPDEERQEMLRTWELLGRAVREEGDVPTVDEAWVDLQSRIHARPGQRVPRRDRKARESSALRRRSLVAGGILLAVAAISLWMWQRPVTAVVPDGEMSEVTLSDGSTIHLNSGTRLRYRHRALPGASHRLRSVELEGEAFFEIAPREQPFIVATASAVVEVLGTQFNVRSRVELGDRNTEVTLASGRVRVSARHDLSESILLTQPGERAHVDPIRGADSSLVTNTATLDYVLAWRRNAFAAIDRSVASIVAELERKYALHIDMETEIGAQNSMTLLYGPNTSVERILHDVCLVQGCRYRPTSRGFALFMPDSDSNNP